MYRGPNRLNDHKSVIFPGANLRLHRVYLIGLTGRFYQTLSASLHRTSSVVPLQVTETRPFALRSDVRHEAAAAQLAARLEQLEAAARDAALFKVCS